MDWNFATAELLVKQGVDLREEMETRLLRLEEQFKKEKEEADKVFEKQKQVDLNRRRFRIIVFAKEYETKIQSLQQQVVKASMLSPDDYLSDDDNYGNG